MEFRSRFDAHLHTIYAELLEQLIHLDATLTTKGLGGTFVNKKIGNHIYWYLQYYEGEKKQKYLGPESKELRSWIDQKKQEQNQINEQQERCAALCKMLVAGGAPALGAIDAKVLSWLSQLGLFRLGGILVGSHAFAAYSNMLGVHFDKLSFRTQDIDLAHDPKLAIALEMDRIDALQKFIQGSPDFQLQPIPSLSLKHPSTSFRVAQTSAYIDLLTPMRGPQKEEPIALPALQLSAYPLRFLDYLLEEPQPTALLGGHGILVYVPHPAWYVFHKLVISQRRPISQQAKSRKDIWQAEILLTILLEDRGDDLVAAWDSLNQNHVGMMKNCKQALKRLPEEQIRLLQKLKIE